MPIRIYKPTSPGRRSMSVSTFEEITKKKPEKSLIEPLKKHLADYSMHIFNNFGFGAQACYRGPRDL